MNFEHSFRELKTIGFIKSRKKNEKRRAILPDDIKDIMNKNCLVFEKGYYEEYGISDDILIELGCQVASYEDVLKQDIICDPKIGDAKYLNDLEEGKTIFGWIHAVQNKDITDKIIDKKMTAFAWEDMYLNGKHVFWKNNVMAGESAILHAFQCYGSFPYGLRCAVIGRGNTSQGAIKVLNQLGAIVEIFDRRSEYQLREVISNYDVIINAVLWDTNRTDHIISRKDLKRMKKDSFIIDISCDKNGGIETCIPTTIEEPTYTVDGILHYAVDHTPTLFYRSTTEAISENIKLYIDKLIMNNLDSTLINACIIRDGKIIDERINEFQERNTLVMCK